MLDDVQSLANRLDPSPVETLTPARGLPPDPSLMFPNRRPAVLRNPIRLCTVVVDAEEDFDWANPAQGVPQTTTNMLHIRTLQEILSSYRIRPTYLLTYPIMDVREIVKLLRYGVDRGECDIGVQLHPWVTPPFDSGQMATTSFAGSLAPEVEERKLVELARKFVECFGHSPRMYRAGRYGLGTNSTALLERLGFTIDTSVAPRTNYALVGGPDFTQYGYSPFWFGKQSSLLEVPLCRDVVGWAGRLAPPLYKALSNPSLDHVPALAALTRLRCAERITLSPEGNDLGAMIRLVRHLVAQDVQIFVVSLHSSSLSIGQNPYVQSSYDLRHLYDRLSGILDFMTRKLSMQFTALADLPSFLHTPT